MRLMLVDPTTTSKYSFEHISAETMLFRENPCAKSLAPNIIQIHSDLIPLSGAAPN